MQKQLDVNPFFLSAFFLNLLIIEFSFPSLGIRGELFAEVGTNFLYHARYSSFWENILKSDCGYLPLFPRLISLVIHFLFPDYWFPFLVNQLTFVTVSLAGAMLNFERFHTVFNQRWLTWFFSVLYCFHHDYDQFALVNISYSFVPLVFFVFVQELLKPASSIDYLGLVILAIAFLSKAAYLAFFPALLASYLLGLKMKQKNLQWLSLAGMAFLIVQVLMLILNNHEGPKVEGASLAQSLVNSVAYSGAILHQTLFPVIKGASFINLVLWIVALILMGALAFEVGFKRVVFFASIVLACSSLILEKSFGIVFDEPGLGFASNRFYWHRGTLISHYAAFILVVYLVLYSERLKRYRPIAMIWVFIINFSVLGNRIFYDRDPFRKEVNSFSHWERDYPQTVQKDFCIPINPKGWKFCHSRK